MKVAASLLLGAALVSGTSPHEKAGWKRIEEAVKRAHAYVKSDPLVEKHSGGVALQNNICQSAAIDCNTNTCTSCMASHSSTHRWVGYCIQDANAELLGAAWGVGTGNTDCSVPVTTREFSVRCTSGQTELEGCNSTLAATGNWKGVNIERQDFTLSSDFSVLDAATGQFDFTSFYNSLSFEMLQFSLDGGATSYINGPPSLNQGTSFIQVPAGGFTNANVRLTGTNSYIVYDAGFQYQASSYPNGVGDTTSYTGVSFTHLTGNLNQLDAYGTGLEANFTAQVCSTQTAPQVCIKMLATANGTNYEGLHIADGAAKADVYVNGISYSGSADSYGLRMMSVSSSYSGTVEVEDTGSNQNEDSETFGTAYLITERTVKASNAQITSANAGSATSVNVQKRVQSLTSNSGSECGYSQGDWYSTSQTVGQESYTNGRDFFQSVGFGTMKCFMYSFPGASTSHTYYMWDPILGVDKAAARENAAASANNNNNNNGDSGSSDDGDNVCFAGGSKVTLESGETKNIEDLEWGERIQVAGFDGSITFSDVMFLPHPKNTKKSKFIELTTSEGNVITLTGGHLVMASESCEAGSFKLIHAKKVMAGHCVEGVRGSEVVKEKKIVSKEGIYSVVAEHADGVVVVDGIKASSFAENHSIANNYYHIHRMIYRYFGHSMLKNVAGAQLSVSNALVGTFYTALFKPFACATGLATEIC